MKQIIYLDIFKEAFALVWKNKFLWLFGFFIMLGSASPSVNFRNSGSDSDALPSQLVDFFQNNPAIAVSAIIVFVILNIALFLLRLIGTAAIIKSTNNIKVYRQSKIRTIISETKGYVWRLFMMEIIVSFTLLLLAIVLFTPIVYLFVLKAYVLGALSLVGAATIMLGIVIISIFLRKYGGMYIILADTKIRPSLEGAYNLFRKNIKESLFMMLISLALNILVFFIFFFGLVSLALVFLPFGWLAYITYAKTGAIAVMIVGLIIAFVLALIIFSSLAAFTQTAWLIFFKQISADKNEEEKLAERLAAENKLPSPEAV